MNIEQLKEAGFNDIEINAWMQKKKDLLSEARFNGKEIDEYFGIKTFDRKPLMDALSEIRQEEPEYLARKEEPPEKLKEGEKPERKEPGIYPEKEPSWIQKFLRIFEPAWEEKRARATLAVEAAEKTGRRPHEFEPTTGEAISKGFKASVTGLLATGKVPEPLPEGAKKYMTPAQRLLRQGSTLLGDMPFMTMGALIGGGSGPPAAVGGAFALPAGLRKVLIDKYENGEVHSFSEFWKRLTDAVWETLKAEAVGVATGAVGVKVPGLGRVPAEVVTMVTVGRALEGEIPEPQEFIDGAIVIGGMRFSTHIAGRLRNVYRQSGKKPAEVIEDIKEDPSIKEDLLSDNKDVPDRYKAFAPEKGFRRKPEPPGEIEKPVKRSDLVNFLKEKLDVPIRTGRFWGAGRRYLGIFKLKEEVIRTKFASDIETICHEVGHGLHKFLWPEARTKAGLSSKPFEPWRKELLAIATKPRAGQPKLPEGFAEFIRLYVTNEKQALEKAPEFYKAFESMLGEKSPEAKEILLETRKEFDKWIKQPAEMRVLSQVSVGAREERLPTWSDLYSAAVDDLHPLMKVVKAMTKGEKIPAEKDPYKLARLMRGWHGRAEHFLEHSPYLFKTYENVGKPLRAILEPVKDNLDEFRALIVSKRALELRNRGIETGILAEDAEFVVNKYEPVYGEIFKDLIKYQDATLAYLVDSGLVSTKTAIKMKKLNQDYVPFYRVMETDRSRGTGVGLQARQPIKRITGSWRDIQDPLESIIKNTYLYINLAEKNAVGRALVNLAESTEGMGKYVERIPEPKQVIKIREPELWGILQKYGKWVETSKYKELKREIEEKVRIGEGEEFKPLDKVEERVREALTTRGFSKGETNQIIERLKGAKTSEAKSKIIERTIEKVAVIETTKEFGLDLPEGVAEIFRPSAFMPKDNVIAVWRAGKKTLYQVHPDVAKTMLALDRESVNLLIRILGMPAGWLRAGATLTPEFIARNPFRDQFSAFAYSKYNFAPGYDLAKGIFSLAKKDEAYWQWKKGGGLRSMLVSMDRRYLQKNLGQVLQKTPVRNIIKNPIEALRILSETMEAATRLGEFKKGIKKEGITKTGMLEAAYASREVTLDFARVGAKTRAVNTLIAFWNANVQGMSKMSRAFKEQPAITTAKVAAGITLPSVILTIVNRQDERWKEIPQWQKDLFWIVMTEDHIWRIPKPFELGILFGTVPERITEYILDQDPHAFDGTIQAIVRGASPGAIPTVAVPWIENWANRSLFLDRPIVPAAREKVLPEYQYKPYTTEVAKLTGRTLGELPAVEKSTFISPARIENLIRGWSGGLGIHILKVADEALRRTGIVPETVKPARTWADIPLIKAFAVRHPSGQAESIKKFYDNYQDIEQIITTIKTLSKKELEYEEAIGILEENAEQVAIRLTGIREGLSNAQKTISFIYENPEIPPDEKRQLIDLIYYQMIDMARSGNDIVEQVRKMAEEK